MLHKQITMAILVGALTIPVAGFAATQAKPQTPTAAKHTSAAAATHATRGVVRSVDASTLVITRGGKSGEMKFMLNPSTEREGTIAVGAPVSVRYREEGKSLVATAIHVQQPKQTAARKTPKQ